VTFPVSNAGVSLGSAGEGESGLGFTGRKK